GPGRAEEDERAGRSLRILDAGPRAADRLRHGDDRRVLADHALVQLLRHADEPLRLRLRELEDGDARPHRDDVGDLLLADLRLLDVLLRAPLLLELALLLRELALLVAQRCGLLELLVLDGGFLVLTDLLDLLLELAIARRSRHRLDAHPRRGLVDQVDRLVRQLAVLDVAPRASAGLRIDAASIAPSAAPAPTRLCSSSMNRMMSPRWVISFITFFRRSSNSPRYFDPATSAARSSV